MAQFVMPKLGADMDAGRLVQWCKKPGESIARGEIIAVIETDKTNIDVESFVEGTVDRLLIEPGDEWLPVGTPLALIRTHGEAPEMAAPSTVSTAVPQGPTFTIRPPAPVAPAETERLRISPSARKLAEELHVDAARVTGTGPGGRITREDIEQAIRAAPAPPPPSAGQPADKAARMRQAIAAAMARSKREAPHYYLTHTIDMGPALEWLNQENLERPVTERLLYGVLFIKAVALALRESPELNAVWHGNEIARAPAIHVGVAISLRQGGLVAPALHDTDKQSLSELMRNFQDLVTRARSGSLRSSEYTDPTITITSLGERGVETVIGVIFPPQVALVGFGKLVERPWVVAGQILVRPTVVASLSADHRASDGHAGARFLATIERLLRTPDQL